MQAHINGIEINYVLDGPESAPVITFSHSLASNLELWEPQESVLRDSYRVLRYDTRGHGRSSAPAGPYSMEMLAEDVIGLLNFLDIRRTHFVGISMGGMIGQVLAARHPYRLKKLILCDTSSRVAPEMGPAWEERIHTAEKEGLAALAQQTLERWLSDEFRRNQPEITARIRHIIVNTPVAGYVGCSRAISKFDMSREISNITTPTLIMVGEKDESAPVSAAEAIQQQVRGSEILVIQGALHLSNIEGAVPFNEKLLDFLS